MPRNEKEKLTGSYEDYLLGSLKDPEEAKNYLNAALEDGDPSVFLLALQDVIKSHGVARIASKAKLNRVAVYRMTSAGGNPETASLLALLSAVGVCLKTEVIRPESVKEDSFEEHYEIQSNYYVTENCSPKYVKPKLPISSAYSYIPQMAASQAAICEFTVTA